MTTQEQALRNARNEIGYAENPAGSNRTKYGAWYGMDGQPWCAQFATWAAVRAGSKAFVQGSRWAYCPYIEQDARAGRFGLSVVGGSNGEPGDLVTFDWEGDGVANHVGFVEVNHGGGAYTTIEGNTSVANNSNGGQVMRRSRSLGTGISMIVRYPNEGSSSPAGRILSSIPEGEPMHLIRDVWQKNDDLYLASDSGLVRRLAGGEAELLRGDPWNLKTVKSDNANAHTRLVQYDSGLRDQEKAD